MNNSVSLFMVFIGVVCVVFVVGVLMFIPKLSGETDCYDRYGSLIKGAVCEKTGYNILTKALSLIAIIIGFGFIGFGATTYEYKKVKK